MADLWSAYLLPGGIIVADTGEQLHEVAPGGFHGAVRVDGAALLAGRARRAKPRTGDRYAGRHADRRRRCCRSCAHCLRQQER